MVRGATCGKHVCICRTAGVRTARQANFGAWVVDLGPARGQAADRRPGINGMDLAQLFQVEAKPIAHDSPIPGLQFKMAFSQLQSPARR